MTTQPLPQPTSSPLASSTDILKRWLSLLRQRISRAAGRLSTRFLVVAGFLGSSYVLGWGEIAVHSSWRSYLQFLVFALFALGLYWFRHTLRDVHVDAARWGTLLPLGFLIGTIRHVSDSWIWPIVLGVLVLWGRWFLEFRRSASPSSKTMLRHLVWDSLFLFAFGSYLFLPRPIFASLVVFLPFALLVVFYNFILERDRLRRAKALSVGTPPSWLRRANRLIPSSTYLFLLLPGLLFAEAFLFHAVYQTTHSASSAQSRPATQHHKYDNLFQQPLLRDWLQFTVTSKMRAVPKPGANFPPETISHFYRELPGGYGLTSGLIRGFLIFFYAKRILLIFLLFMEANLGLRVHRLGMLEQVEGAESRLYEVRQILLRTLDSYPRTWAGFLLRGIQGKHAALDPLSGLVYAVQWIRNRWLPHIIPGMKASAIPPEPIWSRWLREEQIALLGRMQDRTWVLESFIDLLSPAHSSTIRGKIYYYTQIPLLRPLARLYLTPPEIEVKARIIAEIASIIEHAVTSRHTPIVLSDIEIDLLTPEQVWILRDRALQILEVLSQAPEAPIRVAAIRAITRIAALDRPISVHHFHLWEQLSRTLAQSLHRLSPSVSIAQAQGPAPIQECGSPVANDTIISSQNPNKTSPTSSQTQVTGSLSAPDPFQLFLAVTPDMERRVLLEAIGTIGVEHAALTLKEWSDQVLPQDQPHLFHCMGLATQASGKVQAGFPILEDCLLQLCHTLPQHSPAWNTALASLIRLAFPYPIAQTFARQQAQQERQQHSYQLLSQLCQTAHDLEAKNQETPSEEFRERLWSIYHQQHYGWIEYEKQTHALLRCIQDTFWTTLHYSASILLALYKEGEGISHTAEFTDHLSRLSLEDPQGWSEFLAHLPNHLDTSSNYAPVVQFCSWVANMQNHSISPQSMFQHFLEQQIYHSPTVLTGIEQQSQQQQHIIQAEEQRLHEVLFRWTSCLRFRPTLHIQTTPTFAEDTLHTIKSPDPLLSSDTKLSPSLWWRINLTGLSPWIQESTDTPTSMQQDHLYLIYEQATPLPLHPVSQVNWEQIPTQQQLQHGHLSKALYWAFHFHRSPHLHLRLINSSEDRGYWRALEKIVSDTLWQQMNQHLTNLREYRPLDQMDRMYLRSRSKANLQRVFAHSRLREQDSLMIVRDTACKLDYFVEQWQHTDLESPVPTVFFLAGEAGMGHTTLLLQHARQYIQRQTLSETDSPLAFFLDVGQIEEIDDFITWFLRELQTQNIDYPGIQAQPLHWFERSLASFYSATLPPVTTVFYVDGFHEKPSSGIQLLAQILTLAQHIHDSHPWLRFILSTRRSFLDMNLGHDLLQPFVKQGVFCLPERLCYREQSGLHQGLVELMPFHHEPTASAHSSRSELERAYLRYYNFTDASGLHRYRPLLSQWQDLNPFGLTCRLLSYPSLLPVLMETFHQKELPSDLHLIELVWSYFQKFSEPEQHFLQQLARCMLFGPEQMHTPHRDPAFWQFDSSLQETIFLQHPNFLEYLEIFKYGTSIYENLRSRGILIRQWKTPRFRTYEDNLPPFAPQRHITFTSHQLFEYLVFRQLLTVAPAWTHHEDNSIVSPEAVSWLMEVAQHTDHFRPLEGALALLLLHLLEHQQYQCIADFNDQSRQQGIPSYTWLQQALRHVSPPSLTRIDGPLPIILQDLTEHDLFLVKELGRQWHRQGLYPQVDALYGLILDVPAIFDQLQKFPVHLTDLLLERASNHRQILAQQSGGQLSDAMYQEGRALYQRASQRIQQLHSSPLLQARVLRFQAWFEMDTNHLHHANESLHTAWSLIRDNKESASILEEAWIRHLQSAVLRRLWETQSEDPHLWQHEIAFFSPPESSSEPQPLLHRAKNWSEEALVLLQHLPHHERDSLLAQLYDNLARVYIHIADQESNPTAQISRLDAAIEHLKGSVQTKQTHHDFLGLAISYSGLGEAYQQRAILRSTHLSVPHTEDWEAAKTCFHRALRINREQLHSGFGIALSLHALASLYLLHPDHQTDGISTLLEALLAFGHIDYTPGSKRAIQQLARQLASLPVQEVMRLAQVVMDELQKAHHNSKWVLSCLWAELRSILGDGMPTVLQDMFSSTTPESTSSSSIHSQKGKVS